MKVIRSLSILAMLGVLLFTVSCGDDEPKEPDVEDTANPTVSITAPEDGSTLETLDETTDVTITFSAKDETEIGSVVVDFDGTQIDEVTTFTDFLNYDGEVVQAGVADGDHTITVTVTDLAGNSASATSTFTKTTSNPYTALDGEVAYWSFDGQYVNLVTEEEATVVGTPGFAGEGQIGSDAYSGAADAYLTSATENFSIASELTVSMYMKLDITDADRAGIFVMGPEDTENPEAQNVRTSGVRFFREASGDLQIFKWNFGTGEGEVWIDGGDLAKLDPTDGEWHHFAFIIAETTASFYIDGELVSGSDEHVGLDMTGCDILTIGSGAPRFTGWSHLSDPSYIDDLKVFNKALTEGDLETLTGLEFGLPTIEDPGDPGLTPIDGDDAEEILYMSFDTDFTTTGTEVTVTEVGSPSVVDGGVSGKAYSGDADSYLTIPTEGLLNDNFSASMWIKLDPTATRAGLLTASALHEEGETKNELTKGFRFFREGDDLKQTFKMNVGNGEGNAWIDGGSFATFAAAREGWLHVAITVGGGKSQVYLNGILAAQSEEDQVIDWTGCDILSIGSGAPRFQEWGHLGETSLLDELRIYNGILTPDQIAALKAVGD